MARGIASLALALLVLSASGICSGQALQLTIEDLSGPSFAANSLKGTLSGPRFERLALDIGRLTIRDRTWRNVQVRCNATSMSSAQITCRDGVLQLGEQIPFEFTYSRVARVLDAVLRPAIGERWQVHGGLGSRETEWRINIAGGQLSRLAGWIPVDTPTLRAGTVAGEVTITSRRVTAQLQFDGVAFSDASGLHAGEKMQATLRADAASRGAGWNARADLEWKGGEVFWQPFYLKAAGQRANVEAEIDERQVRIIRAALELPGVGDLAASGAWNHASRQFQQIDLRSSRISASGVYEQVLRPLLAGTAFSDMRVGGQLALATRMEQEGLKSLDVTLNDVSVEDTAGRFAVKAVDGNISWEHDGATAATLNIAGGRVLALPFGAFSLPLQLRGNRVAIKEVRMPILDGALVVKNFATVERTDGRSWRFSGEVLPIAMDQLTAALGIPTMHGTLSGNIPQVTFYRSTLDLGGELSIHVFDGTVTARDLQLIEPFGRAPRLHGNVDMANIDLDLLTRTFSFGTITGRADARIADLELVNWQPVRFDARIASASGDYPRRISQKAVENISALGGAGAAVAIQRSFLRFFEQFRYDKLGLTCRLENNVCEMGGIENARDGFVIVKGGGIPAITVIGYNRQVSWSELVDRLTRITQENVRPIVK